MRSPEYWQRRAEARMDGYLRDSEQTMRIIRRAHKSAQQHIAADIDRIWGAYMRAYDLSPEEAIEQLSKPAGRAEYERLLREIAQIPDKELRKGLEARASSGAYAYRVSRLEALQDHIAAHVAKLAAVEVATVSAGLTKLLDVAYTRTIYNIQKGVGLGFSFDRMNKRAVQEILKNPWSGKTFSQRIWGNSEKLTGLLNEQITSGFMTGKSGRKIAREISERMGASYRDAERLVRTETNFIANQAEIQGYIECGIERYIYLATLDDRTSEICAELDGQDFAVKDAMPGANLPPMHPRCRSTTIPYFDSQTMRRMERRARNPVTKKTHLVPGNMTYKEWKAKYAA